MIISVRSDGVGGDRKINSKTKLYFSEFSEYEIDFKKCVIFKNLKIILRRHTHFFSPNSHIFSDTSHQYH